MPYESIWTPPELFLEHNGVRVFATYKDDEVCNGPNDYTFTTDPTNEYSDGERPSFDVRELDVPSRGLLDGHPPYPSESDERYRNASAQQREQWKLEWDQWHAGGERAAVEVILREAIEAGLIMAHEGDEQDEAAGGECACAGGCACGSACSHEPSAADAPAYTFAFDNAECRDVQNAVAAWTDDLKTRGMRASDRVSRLFQRLIDETKKQDAARARRPGSSPATQAAGASA